MARIKEETVGMGHRIDRRLRIRAHLEPDSQRFALEGAGNREHDIGQLGGRIHEEVGMNVEVERRERRASSPDVGVGEEEVGAEADDAAHRERPPLQDTAVYLVRGYMLPAGRAKRPLRQAECAGPSFRRQQLLAADIRGRHGREKNIASRGVETAGQCV